VHDEKLNPRAFHLFRLPVHLEDRLAGYLARPSVALTWPPTERSSVLAELARLSGTPAASTAGPVCLGKAVRLNQAAAIQDAAGTYLMAARVGFRVVPYFED
jgi:hypothetical protein